ncbi:MAG: 2-hydroxychromene-2-carboxylate isomerase, partial [Deltaproteobacteria bacterium]|nr:2-hydroxychromene-2-carboxylate isomerase [Deltaproteobacteria bacterium]
MTQPSFDFYFDYSSPFAYLGSTQVPRLASEFNAHAVLKPVLLGAIFKAIGTPMVPVMTFPDVKRNYYGKDLDRWAEHWGVPFKFTTRF